MRPNKTNFGLTFGHFGGQNEKERREEKKKKKKKKNKRKKRRREEERTSMELFVYRTWIFVWITMYLRL